MTAKQILNELGFQIIEGERFDTLAIQAPEDIVKGIIEKAQELGYNLRTISKNLIGLSIDETVTHRELATVLSAFSPDGTARKEVPLETSPDAIDSISPELQRQSRFLTHPVFNRHHSETEFVRYLKKLENKDLSLSNSMIPLGSCTMKLNATAEMLPISWPGFSEIHPFAPSSQTAGYRELIEQLETWLARITGFAAVSIQPNAGSQGEYAGLLAIREFHRSNEQGDRNVCLIPSSAHGTNPASAVMAGMKVVPINCDAQGNIDVYDLEKKAELHRDRLSALMITYPSTHGVFESSIQEICQIVHNNGGQVYMDGANMNAQCGLTSPGFIGADVCHLNLHKTF